MWKNMLVRQKSKAVVVAVSVLLLMLSPIFISAKEVMFSLCLFVCYQDCAEKKTKTTQPILTKFSGKLSCEPCKKPLGFGSNLDPDP